jgi:hypothetical protein
VKLKSTIQIREYVFTAHNVIEGTFDFEFVYNFKLLKVCGRTTYRKQERVCWNTNFLSIEEYAVHVNICDGEDCENI